jgi:DHA1 family bicyclomycin/chloramphenicol resistance-like MFS transporter
MIRDSCDTRTAQKIMSQVVLLFAMAPAMAPVLGGWLQVLFGWRSVFWFLCGFAVLLLIMGFFVKETLSKDKRQYFHPYHVSRVYWQILRRREFVCLTLSLALMFAGMFVYIAGAPTVIYGFLGLSGDDFGWQFIPMVAGMMLGSFVSGRMVHSWGAARTLTIGFCIGAVGAIANLASALLILPATIISVVAPLVVYSMSYGLVMPVITIMALDYFPERRGSATAVQGFTQVAGNAMVASIAIPLLHAAQSGFAAGQLLFLVLAVILMLYFGFLEKKMADIGARK